MRRLRLAGLVWLVGSFPTMLAGWMLAAVSDHRADRLPGAVLLTLALAAVGVGWWLLVRPSAAARVGSLALSALWLVGAAIVYPTMDFAVDALWAAGVPAVVAASTALLAARAVLPGVR